LIKESAIVSVVGIHDIMYNSDTLRGITYKPFIPLVYAALIYFIMTFTLSKAMGKIEGSMKKSD
jgi:amino acid ABC transporter membrane protein, PAAT family (TC 3.A.1.3.-)